MKNQDLFANLKMQIKKEKLAIIAGGGDLVLSSIESCKNQNISYFLIGIKEFYENLALPPDVYLSLNNIGSIFSILYKPKSRNNGMYYKSRFYIQRNNLDYSYVNDEKIL